MERIPFPTQEILHLANDLEKSRQDDRRTTDRITVTHGYAQLLEREPSNGLYQQKLRRALIDLASAAEKFDCSLQARLNRLVDQACCT
jgi:hypothetical protein